MVQRSELTSYLVRSTRAACAASSQRRKQTERVMNVSIIEFGPCANPKLPTPTNIRTVHLCGAHHWWCPDSADAHHSCVSAIRWPVAYCQTVGSTGSTQLAIRLRNDNCEEYRCTGITVVALGKYGCWESAEHGNGAPEFYVGCRLSTVFTCMCFPWAAISARKWCASNFRALQIHGLRTLAVTRFSKSNCHVNKSS